MNDFVVTIDNEKFSINTDHNQSVSINGTEHEIDVSQLSAHTFKIKLDNKIFHITTSKLEDNKYSFLIDGHYFESLVRTQLEEKAAKILNGNSLNKTNNKIKSPMPGLILRVNKTVGDRVNKGESLILLEAMKMENEIKSHSQGVISEILIEKGNSVEKNQPLMIIK
jgi:biotin carboxyl carrier protein